MGFWQKLTKRIRGNEQQRSDSANLEAKPVAPPITDTAHELTRGMANFNIRRNKIFADCIRHHLNSESPSTEKFASIYKWLDTQKLPRVGLYPFIQTQFIAHWVQHLSQNHNHKVAFLPLSVTCGTHVQNVATTALAARLAFLQGRSLVNGTQVDVAHQFVFDILQQSNSPMILVIAGVETAVWPVHNLIPKPLPQHISILLCSEDNYVENILADHSHFRLGTHPKNS